MDYCPLVAISGRRPKRREIRIRARGRVVVMRITIDHADDDDGDDQDDDDGIDDDEGDDHADADDDDHADNDGDDQADDEGIADDEGDTLV